MAAASLSPTISCLPASHWILRPSRIEMLPRWQALAVRCWLSTSEIDGQVVFEALEEVAHVIAQLGQVAFEQGFHVVHDFFFELRVGVLLLDRLAGDAAAIDEDAPFSPSNITPS